MDRITANKGTFNLLSDILKIAGEYHPKEIKNTLHHVSQTSKGDYQNIMTTLLKNFELLNNLPEVSSDHPEKASDKLSEIKKDDLPSPAKIKPAPKDKPDETLSKSSEKKDNLPSSAKTKPAPKDDPKINELRAMLEDKDFISAKKDVVNIIEKYFKGTVTLRSDNKDSKRDLVAKIISTHKNMEGAEKQKIYSTLRRSYLKSRK